MSGAKELRNLKRKRECLKSRQTLFKQYLEGFLNDIRGVNLLELHKETIVELECRLDKFSDLSKEYDEVQDRIEMLVDELELVEEQRDRLEFENLYFKLCSQGKSFCSHYDNFLKSIDEQESNANATSNQSQRSAHADNLQSVKLPAINLQKFYGDYKNWLEFRDLFDSLINSNETIPPIQKFHYLRTSLEGGAAQVIRGIPLSGENYSLAWNTLCGRYENKNILIQNHVKGLFSLPVLVSENSKELRVLIDDVSKHITSLKGLNQPCDSWDTLLIYILAGKLDKTTSREWEERKATRMNVGMNDSSPKFSEFMSFLKSRADFLENLELSKDKPINPPTTAGNKSNNPNKFNSNKFKPKSGSYSYHALEQVCILCGASHGLQRCPEFLKLSVNERVEKVKEWKLCFNCLKSGHAYGACTSSWCNKCRLKHNTLLHFDRKNSGRHPQNESSNEGSGHRVQNSIGQTNNQGEKRGTDSSLDSSTMNMSSEVFHGNSNQVLLQTALVQVVDSKGVPQVCRALLDSASQSNFITKECCDKLGLKLMDVPISVTGVGHTVTQLKHGCQIKVHSLKNAYQLDLSCVVIPKIGGRYPSFSIDSASWQIPNNLVLADPGFGISGEIDLLIGSGEYLNLLCIGQIRLGDSLPTLQKTKFGWIIGGECRNARSIPSVSCHFVGNILNNQDLHNQMAKFWEIEEVNVNKILSHEEKQCVKFFKETTIRDVKGRFIVQMPLKKSPESLGDSKQQAIRRFYSLESKLLKNPDLREKYVAFIEEYQALSHMNEISPAKENGNYSFYFPHHCVTNDKSPTTKLRVVFDGSAVSDSGESLNSIQMVGPTLQDELFQIILRFRQHNVVVCADIIKMYRQIHIADKQLSLQRIVWRADPSHDLKIFELQTVTYGTSSAPYLAVQCLQQVALESNETHPLAAKVISRDFYMDDMITGMESATEAIKLCDDVSDVLKQGCFELQKWASNSKQVLDHLRSKYSISPILVFGETEKTKTLGLYWSCDQDYLMYNINQPISDRITKRTVLSAIAQIFDPLGLLGPCIIIAKIILQRLWLLKVSWDESLPSDINSLWCKFQQTLPSLNNLQIPRQVLCVEPIRVEIHGFADASLESYGACVYLRSVNKFHEISVKLLCAKSKVAPLKSITVPRLELCACLILAKLVHKVKESMNIAFDSCVLWTDSSVCLSWIQTPSHMLQIFVGNRVSQIQSLTLPEEWNHISSKDNPADVLSRGLSPEKLQECDLWWKGPTWLSKPQSNWPKSKFDIPEKIPELRKQIMVFKTMQNDPFPITRFSRLSEIQHVCAYCLRFSKACQNKIKIKNELLTVNELNEALLVLIKLSQQETFSDEIAALLANKYVSKSSKLKRLNPFVDEHGVLRVGGRIENSQFDFEKKHPIVLCAKHHLTIILLRSEHFRLHHAGPQHLMFSIREKYWPIGGRTLARKIVHECVRCFRVKPRQQNVIMGMLPQDRLRPSPPFFACGVDYAGPVLIKDKKGRGNKKIKAYISLFVCFSTKAVHLELVTELTKDAFIAAFRRFVARRGKPNKMFSDNGTNFVGAKNELELLGEFLRNNSDHLIDFAAQQGIEWHFIPAFAPHFGGIWEAGVKSCKVHLKRVLANACLTYEDLCTVLNEIEAILNSRPLTPMSSDPNDCSSLTPSHFLIGKPVTSLPDPDVQGIPETRLSHYQRLQQIQQHFWSRWALEYVSELQVLQKWHTSQLQLKIGMLVIIKQDNIPPLQWCMGRVVELHPGRDGIARVATIKTANGHIKRALSKICVLPIDIPVVEPVRLQGGGHVNE